VEEVLTLLENMLSWETREIIVLAGEQGKCWGAIVWIDTWDHGIFPSYKSLPNYKSLLAKLIPWQSETIP